MGFFSDSTEAAYKYQMAHGIDGMVDTPVDLRLGIVGENGKTRW
jgi:hypothetical protein